MTMRFRKRLSRNQWFLVAGAVSVVIWLGWPYVKRPIGTVSYVMAKAAFRACVSLSACDTTGSMAAAWHEGHARRRRGGADYEAPGGDPLSGGQGGDYPRDQQGHPLRRWRYCVDSPGRVQQCGPWQVRRAREGE